MSNPFEKILLLSTAYWASRALHVAAELGVADALDNQPRTAAELAPKVGADPLALHRLLRALVNHGIFELKDGRFSHNDCSQLLRTDVPNSMRARAIMDGLPVHWNAYGALGYAVKTGRPAVERIIQEPNFFAYLGNHPDEARIFAGAMAGKSLGQIRAVLDGYDFSGMKTIGDIGGSTGHLLNAVLDAYPGASGVLFELPEIIAEARTKAHPRVEYVGGDFFKDPIPSCDAYLLMMVLHDWSDAEGIAILRNIRRTAPATAKVLIIEGVVDESAGTDLLFDIDVEMMALTTGRERTREDWSALLQGAGFRIERILPVAPWTAIVEGVVA
jgi:hypothetical protein